jgi:WD40 repeat protein
VQLYYGTWSNWGVKQVGYVVLNLPLFLFTMLLERVIAEHSRAVNRICFQPDNGNVLLSASQDGTMKCWVNFCQKEMKGGGCAFI